MKLTSVKTYVVKTDPPNWGGTLWFFGKLETDEGIEGWGETAVLGCLAGLEDSYETMVREIFHRYLKGQDPINREPLYHILYSSLTAQHPDPSTTSCIRA
jgi:L-alanine-DL-glutamate epimerase-like enolase superfamily enzyme